MSPSDTPWGASFRIEYYWHETASEVWNCGRGVIHYDANLQRYALHNTFANEPRELGYILDEASGVAYVFETRSGVFHCSRHETDRKVRLHRQVVEGEAKGQGAVTGHTVRFVDFNEPGDHDHWFWCLSEDDEPLRFFTWTHHGKIGVLHDLIKLERDRAIEPEVFRIPSGCD